MNSQARDIETGILPGDDTSIGDLPTEQRNPRTMSLDECSSLEIVRLMNEEDSRIAASVRNALPAIARLVDAVTARLQEGGRLFYAGAGTSGRLGMLDAAECPPTFGVDPAMVQCLMAGGPGVMARAGEAAEDAEQGGRDAVAGAELGTDDILVGIAASGRTPFVRGAILEARSRGCFTAVVTNHMRSPLGKLADVAIDVPVGPEVVTGSTRLKAGTAQKMILNMISTASMVRLGKVYSNLMVDVTASNEKLRDRARRIVSRAAGIDIEDAARFLDDAGGSAKIAILMASSGCSRSSAEARLFRQNGNLRRALADAG